MLHIRDTAPRQCHRGGVVAHRKEDDDQSRYSVEEVAMTATKMYVVVVVLQATK